MIKCKALKKKKSHSHLEHQLKNLKQNSPWAACGDTQGLLMTLPHAADGKDDSDHDQGYRGRQHHVQPDVEV